VQPPLLGIAVNACNMLLGIGISLHRHDEYYVYNLFGGEDSAPVISRRSARYCGAQQMREKMARKQRRALLLKTRVGT
jgi:hypothetical protein